MSSFALFVRRALSCASAVLGLLACGHALAFINYPTFGDVYEFVNEDTGRYILLTNDELKSGLPTGWRRTGYVFGYPVTLGSPFTLPSPVPVCHFYAVSTDS